MSAHTPGPWHVRVLDGSLGTIDDADDNSVAQALEVSSIDRNTGHKQRQANAHLIAAAPMLLEALERLMNGTTTLQDALEANQQARAAIKAAKGEA